MKEHDAYPSKWLAASDLEEPVLAVIAGAEFAVVGNERKVVITFQGGKKPNGKFTVLKPMICNKTNFKEIKRILGQDDTEDWTGGEVVLTSQMVEFGGELVPGIRVRAPSKKQPKAQSKDPKPPHPGVEDSGAMDDEIPF